MAVEHVKEVGHSADGLGSVRDSTSKGRRYHGANVKITKADEDIPKERSDEGNSTAANAGLGDPIDNGYPTATIGHDDEGPITNDLNSTTKSSIYR